MSEPVVAMANELGEMLEHAPCGFVSFRDDGKIEYINSTLLERLGYDRAELGERHIEGLLTVGGKIFYQTHLFPLVKLHGRAQEVFLLFRAKNGDDVGMLCNALRRERGPVAVTDCALMEVQERRKFEDALLQARQAADKANVTLEIRTQEAEAAAEQLESQAMELEMQQQQLQELNHDLQKQREIADDANRAKSNFLAVMSHELRTPLNAIGGYVQLLQIGVHGPVTNAQTEALGRIDRSQRHLLRLINEILNLARIESGRVDYLTERVSLSEVVGSVMPMVEPQAKSKGLRLESAVANGVSATADREKVEQVLLNLLTNAVKFTSTGGTVRVEGGDLPSLQVFLRVRDSGIGIPSDMLEKVFEPFVQVDATRSRAVEGTGLGLAISRDLARGMHGDLVAESEPGKGSVFQLTLPSAVG